MDTLYHISGDGTPRACEARLHPCPLPGGHYPTIEAALLSKLSNDYAPPAYTPQVFLQEALRGQGRQARYLLAADLTCTPELITLLAKDSDLLVREKAAQHPNLPAPAINWLLKKEIFFQVLQALASNKNLEADHIRILGIHHSDSVRDVIASRKDIPLDTQEHLAGDTSTRAIRVHLASNPTAHAAHTKLMEQRHEDMYLQRTLAKNPGLADEHVRVLSYETDARTKVHLLAHPKTDAATIERLLHDEDARVRVAAQQAFTAKNR